MNSPLSPPYYGPFMQVAPGGGPGQDIWTTHHQPRILNIAATAAADSVAQTGRGDFTPVRVRITIDLLVETVLQWENSNKRFLIGLFQIVDPYFGLFSSVLVPSEYDPIGPLATTPRL